MKCRECDVGEMVVSREDHSYTEKGMDITIENMEMRRCSNCDYSEEVFEKMEGLYQAIIKSFLARPNEPVRMVLENGTWRTKTISDVPDIIATDEYIDRRIFKMLGVHTDEAFEMLENGLLDGKFAEVEVSMLKFLWDSKKR